MEREFQDKTILVTGAGQGIGQSLCKHLFTLGANVIAVSRNQQHLNDLSKESNGKIKTIQLDLNGNWNQVKKVLTLEISNSSLDGLVNNAGVAHIKPFEELTEEDFDSTFNVNAKSVFNVTQSLVPKLKEGSSIVNISSLASTRSFEGHSIYSATKAAVDSLTRSLAMELGPKKIRVNSVNPTVILTQMGRANWSDPKKSKPLLSHIPMNRFGEVSEVIDSVLYLLGKQSSFVNGHHLLLEGGYSVS